LVTGARPSRLERGRPGREWKGMELTERICSHYNDLSLTGLSLGGGSETRALSPQPPLPILGEGEQAFW